MISLKQPALGLICFITCLMGQCQPANDNCATATAISISSGGNACITGSTVGATSTTWTTAQCGQTVWPSDVWYTFVSTGTDNTVIVSPTGNPAGQQLGISIFTGSCNELTGDPGSCEVASVNNATDTAFYAAPTGTIIYVEVSTFGTSGSFQLCVNSTTPPAPPGGTCATAAWLCNLDSFSVATIPHGGSTFTPDCFDAIPPPVDGQWYQFTVGVSGLAAWKCTPTDTLIELDWAMYDITSGCPTASNQTSEVGCNYDYAGSESYPIGMSPTSVTECPVNQYPPTPIPSQEFCPSITLAAGHTYAIFINNYSYPRTTGWDFNFTGSTFQMGSVNAFSVSPDTICGSQGMVTITNTPVDTGYFVWNFGDGTTDTAANPGTHFYSQPGNYTITLKDSVPGGCVSVNSKQVVIGLGDTITLPSQQTCAGTAINISAPTISTATYLWSAGGATTQSITVAPNVTSNYTVTCTPASGCIVVANIALLVTNSPVIYITGDTVTCLNNAVTLTTGTGNAYNWSNGLGSNAQVTVSPTTTTTYYVTVTLGAGCSATGSATVTVNYPRTSQLSQSICEGFAYTFYNRVLTQSGIYYDTMQTVQGCDSIVTLHLTVDSLAVPTISQHGDTLQTQQFATYQWLLNGADVQGGGTQSIVITQNGQYTVAVTDTNGCAKNSVALNVINLGIFTINADYGVTLYPNPNTGNFILEFTDDILREVEITDLTGRVVMTPVKVARQKNFNLGELANGVYFLRINQNNAVRSLKFSIVK